MAAQNGHASLVDILLAKGADLSLCLTRKAASLSRFSYDFSSSIADRMHLFLRASKGPEAFDTKISVSPLQIACIMGRDKEGIISKLWEATERTPREKDNLLKLEKFIHGDSILGNEGSRYSNFFTDKAGALEQKIAQDMLFLYLCFGTIDIQLLPDEAKSGRLAELAQSLQSESLVRKLEPR